jgi:cytochrome c oxidase subunit II
MNSRLFAFVAIAALSFHASAFTLGQSAQEPVVIKVVAKKYEFNPSQITVKVGVPVVLELTSADRVHGFSIPELKLKAEIKPGEITRLPFTPDKPGTYPFKCDVYCGSGHPNMKGELVVTQ